MIDRKPAAQLAGTSPIARLRRRTRRILVAATLIGYPGMYAWYAVMHDTSVPVLLWGPISLVLVGLTFVCGLVLAMWARNRASLSDSTLDERERQVRDHAYTLSYQFLAWVATLGLLGLGLVTAFGRPVVLTFDILGPIVVGTAIYLPSLPYLALAWTEPDPLPEDA
jgi:hypothetical protein